jgi:hypothetical protein
MSFCLMGFLHSWPGIHTWDSEFQVTVTQKRERAHHPFHFFVRTTVKWFISSSDRTCEWELNRRSNMTCYHLTNQVKIWLEIPTQSLVPWGFPLLRRFFEHSNRRPPRRLSRLPWAPTIASHRRREAAGGADGTKPSKVPSGADGSIGDAASFLLGTDHTIWMRVLTSRLEVQQPLVVNKSTWINCWHSMESTIERHAN